MPAQLNIQLNQTPKTIQQTLDIPCTNVNFNLQNRETDTWSLEKHNASGPFKKAIEFVLVRFSFFLIKPSSALL